MVTLVGVCHFLYLIILVPYNLFGLFLVHKISAYKYIYEMGKRNGKRKRKREFQLAGPGGISAHPGASARGGALAAQLRSTGGETTRVLGSDGVTAGPHVSESGGGGAAPRSDGAGEPVVCG
jgi:hypothetical protein